MSLFLYNHFMKLIMTYVIEFSAGAFYGWIYEIALELILHHAYTDRGILHMPLIPIYGFGCLLLLLLYRNKKHSALFILFTSALITTVLELAVSYPLEKILGYLPWSYAEWPLNFDGRISVLSSLLFGVLAAVFIKLIHPACRKLERAPAVPVIVCGLILGTAILSDGIYVFTSSLIHTV